MYIRVCMHGIIHPRALALRQLTTPKCQLLKIIIYISNFDIL